MELIEVKDIMQGALKVSWMLNNICNNTCSYCTPNLYAGKNHHYDWEHARGFVKELHNRHEKIVFLI